MHPVNAFKTLVHRRLKELGIRKSQLAQELGYRNTAKGLRRIDAILDAELDEELTRRVARVLMISRAELERALADQHARKERERLEREARDRAAFRRSLTLIRAYDPPNWLGRWRMSLESKVPLPPLDDGVSLEEELTEVVRHFQQSIGDRFPEPDQPVGLTGFYYHRTYDHGYLCDEEANLIREDHHHVSPSSIFIAPAREINFETWRPENPSV